MKLTELEPKFLIRQDDNHFRITDNIREADGIQFLCPVCFIANTGSIGTHSIICWTPRVPQTTQPIPGRWNLLGSGYEDLTLQAGSSSVLLQSAPCKAHFFVRNGAIENC